MKGCGSVVKRCLFCGRYFIPDVRVGQRQKACSRVDCKKARKKSAQVKWVEKNPGYFRGRYPYVKAWRKRMVQDKIPPKRPYVELVIRIPAKKKYMIQDEIIVKRIDSRTFAAHGYG
jgi:hypothetical protein